MRQQLKRAARGMMLPLVLPALLSYRLRALILGRDRALANSSQALACIPGHFGQYLRRAFFGRVLAACHHTATIEFGTLFSQAGARVDAHAYIGPRCHLGLVHVQRDVLLAAGVHVPSGPHSHGTDCLDTPMASQPGTPRLVTIGAGAWVGSAAIVMADVGRDAIVAAGAVVTRPVADRAIVAGVPARVVGVRGSVAESA